MNTKAVLAIAFATTLSAPFADAFSIVDTTVVRGTITSVDAVKNTLEIEKRSGGTETLQFSNNATLYVNGNAVNLDEIAPGHVVQIKHKTYTPADTEISGEIVALNHREKTAHIRVAGKDVVEVKFGSDPAVAGEVDTFSELRRGHQVVLRYPNQ